MDITIVISAIVATVAIIPGVWALIAESKKASEDMQMLNQLERDLELRKIADIDRKITMRLELSKPRINRCKYCDTIHSIVDGYCSKCGAPES